VAIKTLIINLFSDYMRKRGTRGLERIRWYVDYILDLVGIGLDESKDLVAQVRDKLEEVVEEARKGEVVIPEQSIYLGRGREFTFDVEDILKFLREAQPEQLDVFRRELLRELRRRKRLSEEVGRIEEEVRRYVKSLGVYVPFAILDYDRFKLWENKYHFIFKAEIGAHKYLDEYEGTLDELIELFKEVVRRESREISRLIRRARSERERWIREVGGLSEFLSELESHVIETAILTITGPKLARPSTWRGLDDGVIIAMGMGLEKAGDLEAIKWDITRVGPSEFVYGAHPHLWPEFYGWFVESLRSNGVLSIILRSFRKEVDELTGLPVKELRGYVVSMSGGRITYRQLTARELFEAHTTDPVTGERIEPEPAVIYCGPGDDRIYSIRGA